MTIIGDAVTGLVRTVAGIKEARTPHQVFIEEKLIPHTLKVQKEAGWRRYKDAQKPLHDALVALKEFQKEEWPKPSSKSSQTNTTSQTEKTAPDTLPNCNFPDRTQLPPPINGSDKSTFSEKKEKEQASVPPGSNDSIIGSMIEGDSCLQHDENSASDFVEVSATTSQDFKSNNLDESQQLPLDNNMQSEKLQLKSTHLNDDTFEYVPSTNDIAVENLRGSTVDSKETGSNTEDEQFPPQNIESLSNGVGSDVSSKKEILVHKAIVKTVKAYLAVLGNRLKVAKATELALAGIVMIVEHQYYEGHAGGIDDLSGSGRLSVARAEKEKNPVPPPSLLHRILQGIATTSESNSELVQVAVVKTLTTIVSSPKCHVHEGSLLLAMKSTFHVYLVTKSATCRETARIALMNMLKAAFMRMEAHSVLSVDMPRSHTASLEAQPRGKSDEFLSIDMNGIEFDSVAKKNRKRATTEESSSSTGSIPSVPTFASQYHADVFFLFRALCRLSSKELPADDTDESERKGGIFSASVSSTDPNELNSKLLSLELILAAVEICGEAFTTGDRFLYLVQQYMSGALLKNCLSNQTHVAFLSQKIFLVLVFRFKDSLKRDIEVFTTNVFFRVLESPNSSFKQKALVLESLRTLCKDPVLLTQIFLNYDCDFDSMSLYKEIIQMLTKQGGKATSSPVSKKEAEREFDLSLAAIECLVNILKTFLITLGLPRGDVGDESDDNAGIRLRSILNLTQALVVAPASSSMGSTADTAFSDDTSIHSVRTVVTSNHQFESSTSDFAVQIVDAFDRKMNAAQNFEIGSVKFTLSLKNGLNYFIQHGFLSLDAREIALFFLTNKDKLDKTQMGEALGREPRDAFVKDENIEADKGGPGFWFRILHYYTEFLDFRGIRFDEAIRLFLSGFRLPGEAQKIDRIMEKFAERFTAQNPDVFPSSDTAFILAFSVIMLNTDLHNPSIKPEKRMTVESFLRNNRGIGENGSDLPDDFLRGIFERIKESPFSLKEDDVARERAGGQKPIFDFDPSSSLFGGSAEERRRENFKKERDEMMSVTERLIKRRSRKNASAKGSSIINTIPPSDVVKPMFDITWGPMLGILSQVLECSDDDRSVSVCLNGFVYAVRLAANSSMSLARDTFVSSLAKFTFLGSIKEMKRKNVESIRSLLSIAIVDGQVLGESWGPVLQCISQLAKLRLTGSGLDSDESFLLVEEPKRLSKRDAMAREAEENNAKAVLEAVQEVLIDKVFSSTFNLSATSLAHFIEQLIAVSSSEIKGHARSGMAGVEAFKKADSSDGPSIFMLQRLVDVADHNMNVRPRLVWAQVWDLMADFFVENACHSNLMVSVFAIDSLKQLSLKFLDKPELSEFSFQSSFLRPFQVVMENKNTRDDIRELVLSCVDIMIRTKSKNLRSGWKVLFTILTASAHDPNEKIETLGLTILQRLLDDHLDDVGSLADKHVSEIEVDEMSTADRRNRNTNAEDFICLCKTSLSFLRFDSHGSVRPIGLTLRAFCHTAIYADLIASKRVLPPISGDQVTDHSASGFTYEGLSEKESLEMILWRPLFEGLAGGAKSLTATSDSGVGCFIQRASILGFRAIILRHRDMFSSTQMAAILSQTLLPAILEAAMKDKSPVISITSESPLISNIDFLADSLPMPPAVDDALLLKFQKQSNNLKRSMGPAELMLEASLTDLRHGGDGDLRKAYLLAKKSPSDSSKAEQPFPDSWIATTASLALGFVTEIVTELVMLHGELGRRTMWPLIEQQYRRWILGTAKSPDATISIDTWLPCEALVRVSCREILRLARRHAGECSKSTMSDSEKIAWSSLLLSLYTDLLTESVSMEEYFRLALLNSRINSPPIQLSRKVKKRRIKKPDIVSEIIFYTPYGKGKLVNRKRYSYIDAVTQSHIDIVIDEISLNFGALLYRPSKSSLDFDEEEESGDEAESLSTEPIWIRLVPLLKIRCVAAHCLQQSLLELVGSFTSMAGKDIMSSLLHCLETSKLTSASAVGDDDISTAFQQSLLDEWGGGGQSAPDETTESSARFSLLHGSTVFFLAQEASATKAIVHSLSSLYLGGGKEGTTVLVPWNRITFAESHLMKVVEEICVKFIDSERTDGRLIEPNAWRNTNEIGMKVAIYCTAFASVIVDVLFIIKTMPCEQFEKHKNMLYPILCSLILVQSDEVRALVQEIMVIHVAPMIHVRIPLSASVAV